MLIFQGVDSSHSAAYGRSTCCRSWPWTAQNFRYPKKAWLFSHRNLYRVKVWAKVSHLCWKFENSKNIPKSLFFWLGRTYFFHTENEKEPPFSCRFWNQDMCCFHWKRCDFQVGESFLGGEVNLLKWSSWSLRSFCSGGVDQKTPHLKNHSSLVDLKRPEPTHLLPKIDRKRTYKFETPTPRCCVFLCWKNLSEIQKKITSGLEISPSPEIQVQVRGSEPSLKGSKCADVQEPSVSRVIFILSPFVCQLKNIEKKEKKTWLVDPNEFEINDSPWWLS